MSKTQTETVKVSVPDERTERQDKLFVYLLSKFAIIKF